MMLRPGGRKSPMPNRGRCGHACFSLSHKGFDVSYCEIRAVGSVGLLLRTAAALGCDRLAERSISRCETHFGIVRQAVLCVYPHVHPQLRGGRSTAEIRGKPLLSTATARQTAHSGITVSVSRCVVALPLSVMSRVAEGVTFGHLLPVGAGYPVPAGSRVL